MLEYAANNLSFGFNVVVVEVEEADVVLIGIVLRVDGAEVVVFNVVVVVVLKLVVEIELFITI